MQGFYQHYKGNYYQVLGTVLHSETMEELVLYKPIKTEQLWVRPKDMFMENVTIDNVSVPRFRKLSETELQNIKH